jgi:unsaturated chondroitin disaccharide hydrolase
MNLSILYWASKESGDPRFAHIATAHIDTVLKYFLREDGSSCHIASFDPQSGEFKEFIGGQGYGPNSAWSRGQAWAIYGLANVYDYTKDERYLNASKRVANYFIAALEDDYVPYWDLRLPTKVDQSRDTSAASITASGLLTLCEFLPKEEKTFYKTKALHILESLTNSYADFDSPNVEAILREGTGNRPINQNINVGLIYGDYFYVEALAKLNDWKSRIF